MACRGFAEPPSVIDRYYHTRYFRQPVHSTASDPRPAAATAIDRPSEELYIHFHNNGSVPACASIIPQRNKRVQHSQSSAALTSR